MTGHVTRYSEALGYGVLVGADGRSYFLHRTAVVGPPLCVGDAVDFRGRGGRAPAPCAGSR